MTSTALFFLLMIFLCLITQGFFAMIEMACVSFNKVRLQYYVSHHNRRALWLSRLLHRPAFLFGTTLIGVNTSLILGSECARRFYDSLGLRADFAPLSQVVLVLIFAELAPLFAARRYAEHVALLGIPLLYFFSILLRPLTWGLDYLCRGVGKLAGKPLAPGAYLSREELQNMLEEKEEGISKFNTLTTSVFNLKNKTAKDVMQPLTQVTIVPSFCTVGEMRQLVQRKKIAFLPIYHRQAQNIVSIAYPRDLLRLPDHKRIKEHARQAWFITENTSILHLLKQFRRNNQSLSVVLNDKAVAVGILTLDEVVDEIFGRSDAWNAFEDRQVPHVVLDRSFPADTQLSDFNAQFCVNLSYGDAETLEEVMSQALGHRPTREESVRVEQFELTAEETSFLGVKMIQVRYPCS